MAEAPHQLTKGRSSRASLRPRQGITLRLEPPICGTSWARRSRTPRPTTTPAPKSEEPGRGRDRLLALRPGRGWHHPTRTRCRPPSRWSRASPRAASSHLSRSRTRIWVLTKAELQERLEAAGVEVEAGWHKDTLRKILEHDWQGMSKANLQDHLHRQGVEIPEDATKADLVDWPGRRRRRQAPAGRGSGVADQGQHRPGRGGGDQLRAGWHKGTLVHILAGQFEEMSKQNLADYLKRRASRCPARIQGRPGRSGRGVNAVLHRPGALLQPEGTRRRHLIRGAGHPGRDPDRGSRPCLGLEATWSSPPARTPPTGSASGRTARS
jgi:hypothetical protein